MLAISKKALPVIAATIASVALLAQDYNVPFRPRAAAGGGAIAQTGTVVSFDGTIDDQCIPATNCPVVTVPDDANFVVVGIAGYNGSAVNYFSTGSVTIPKGGSQTAMTAATTLSDASTGPFMGAMFYLAQPDTGSGKEIRWDWLGTSNGGDNIKLSVIFFKNVNTTTPVRSASGDQDGDVETSQATVTTASGDFVLGWESTYDGGTGSEGSWATVTGVTTITNVTSHATSLGSDGVWFLTPSPNVSSHTMGPSTSYSNVNDGGLAVISMRQ